MMRKNIKDYESESIRDEKGCLVYPFKVKMIARKTYKMRHGSIPKGLNVCHTCDNGMCIEDDHHFLGTQKDNIRDGMNKGRIWGQAYRDKVIPLMKIGSKKRSQNPAWKKNISEAIHRLWQNPEFRKARVEAIKNWWAKRKQSS